MSVEEQELSNPATSTAARSSGLVFEGNGAEILTETLVRAGVKTLFGVPGDTGMAWYDALYHASNRIQHVLARDERHAATMADVFSRVTNTVGVVEVSGGGGTTFVVGGLGEPFAASVPVLLITSDIHTGSRDTGALTEIDQQALFGAVTKWRDRADHAGDIPRLVERALQEATTGRPAPVAIIVPEDVLEEYARVRVAIDESAIQLPGSRFGAMDEVVELAADRLYRAERPAIVAGGGIHASAAWDELAQFADHAGIPVATTISGKGSMPDTDQWSLGVVGANGARPYVNEYLAGADVVLFIGTRANATDTNSFKSPPRNSDCVVFQIDVDPTRAGRNYPESVGLVGDARSILQQLFQASPSSKADRRGRLLEWMMGHKEEWSNVAAGSRPLKGDSALDPREIVHTLSGIDQPNLVLVADCGTPTPNIASYWQSTKAGRQIVIPRGHGPMGYAIPGAVGAALARPNQPVLAITTDGSFAMACGELETVSRLGLPILFIQMTNHSLGWIKMLQHLYLGQRYFGVDPGPIDSVGVARSCGLAADRVDTLEELKQRAEDALTSRIPTYLEVEIPDQLTLPPPVAPWQSALTGEDEQRPVY